MFPSFVLWLHDIDAETLFLTRGFLCTSPPTREKPGNGHFILTMHVERLVPMFSTFLNHGCSQSMHVMCQDKRSIDMALRNY